MTTDKKDAFNSEGHAVCDNCQSNFACSRLFISLKIAEITYLQMEKNHPNYRIAGDKIATIKKLLDDSGWSYPHSLNSCKYAFELKEVWRELEGLTKLIQSMSFKNEVTL